MCVKMPPRFIQILADENFLDIHRANKWLFEYKKFLILMYMTAEPVVPSEQVQIVWNLHSSYMPHYRAMCFRLGGGMILLNQRMKFGLSDDERKYYRETLAFYSDVF